MGWFRAASAAGGVTAGAGAGAGCDGVPGFAAAPPFVLNVTGADALSVRELATQLGERLGVAPRFTGTESPDALLSSTIRMHDQFAAPELPLSRMLDWVASWVRAGRPLLGKPTHFAARDGAF